MLAQTLKTLLAIEIHFFLHNTLTFITSFEEERL